MRVLQINTVCGTGSTGKIATDIHNFLKKKNFESYVAYGRGEAKNCDNPIKIGNNLDVYFHVLMTRLFDRHSFFSKKATSTLIKKIEKLDPDIIHLHNIHGYYLNIEILFEYLKRCNKKIIWTLHDCWSFTGHCVYFDFVGCDKWRSKCEKCIQKKTYPSSFYFDNSKVNYQNKKEIFSDVKNLSIVTPSKWLESIVKDSFLKEYKIETIYNGIDLNIFKERESNFREKFKLKEKFIILGVASPWIKRKGFEDFIGLSKKLEEDMIIVMVGLSKRQISELPVKIIGIEKTNNSIELAEIYSAADVFFNPTYEEVLGLTNLEAIACGTPVITYDSGGSPECVTKENGIVIKKSEKTEVLKRIKELKNNKRKIGKISEKFDKENFIKKIIDKYSEN